MLTPAIRATSALPANENAAPPPTALRDPATLFRVVYDSPRRRRGQGLRCRSAAKPEFPSLSARALLEGRRDRPGHRIHVRHAVDRRQNPFARLVERQDRRRAARDRLTRRSRTASGRSSLRRSRTSPPQRSQTPAFAVPRKSVVIAGAAIAARETAGDARGQGLLVDTSSAITRSRTMPASRSIAVQRLGLGRRCAESRQARTPRRRPARQGGRRRCDHDDIVRHQLAGRHDRPGALADFRAPLRRLAEHVACGDMLGCRTARTGARAWVPLPDPGGPKRMILIVVSRAAGSCATGPHTGAREGAIGPGRPKSIVTFTTIRRLVPPK